jgi:ribosomal protein S18 acetylase RimI-like enzyme
MFDISTVTLRTALASDLAGIRFVDPLMRADPERARLIQSAVENGECVVAADDDEILGFAILNYTFFYQGFVPLLVVGVGSRRCGVGAALLSELERRCAKAKLYVSANRSNLPAQLLFEKCGFVESGHVAHLDANDVEVFYFKAIPRHGP